MIWLVNNDEHGLLIIIRSQIKPHLWKILRISLLPRILFPQIYTEKFSDASQSVDGTEYSTAHISPTQNFKDK